MDRIIATIIIVILLIIMLGFVQFIIDGWPFVYYANKIKNYARYKDLNVYTDKLNILFVNNNSIILILNKDLYIINNDPITKIGIINYIIFLIYKKKYKK